MRRAGRQCQQPGDDVPDDRAGQSGEDDVDVQELRFLVDQSLADRARDVGPEQKRRHEIEERRPYHRLCRRENARRHDRRDRVRRVVKPVEKVKDQGDEDDEEDESQHEIFDFRSSI